MVSFSRTAQTAAYDRNGRATEADELKKPASPANPPPVLSQHTEALGGRARARGQMACRERTKKQMIVVIRDDDRYLSSRCVVRTVLPSGVCCPPPLTTTTTTTATSILLQGSCRYSPAPSQIREPVSYVVAVII